MESLNLINIFISIFALLIAIIGHELMHGLSAFYYGDNTAKLMGRLSINPIKHIDLVGSLLVPFALFLVGSPILFGWAKPVPVNMGLVINKGGYNAAIMVSLSGIIYNLSLAIMAAAIINSGVISNTSIFNYILYVFLYGLVTINIVLAVFNLLPIPPLDGSQALSYLSLKFNSMKIPMFFNRIERYGFLIVMAIVLMPHQFNIIFIIVNFLLKILLGRS